MQCSGGADVPASVHELLRLDGQNGGGQVVHVVLTPAHLQQALRTAAHEDEATLSDTQICAELLDSRPHISIKYIEDTTVQYMRNDE